jgi:hypothetical protein
MIMSSSRRTRPAPLPAANDGADCEQQSSWTAERIHGLGASTDLATAAAILGMSRSAAYKLIRRDAFPVPLYRVGTHYRVPTAPILAALHLQPSAGAQPTGCSTADPLDGPP